MPNIYHVSLLVEGWTNGCFSVEQPFFFVTHSHRLLCPGCSHHLALTDGWCGIGSKAVNSVRLRSFRDENSDLLIAGWLDFKSCCCRSGATKCGSWKRWFQILVLIISWPVIYGVTTTWDQSLQMYFTCESNKGWVVICTIPASGLWQGLHNFSFIFD